MKPRKPPRHCVVCGDSYRKKGSAKTCGSLECRAENARRRHARWRPQHRAELAQRDEAFRKANLTYFSAYYRARRARLKVAQL